MTSTLSSSQHQAIADLNAAVPGWGDVLQAGLRRKQGRADWARKMQSDEDTKIRGIVWDADPGQDRVQLARLRLRQRSFWHYGLMRFPSDERLARVLGSTARSS